ncbi:MAG: TRAP transporter small permease [Gammaproteobacteria bacterium]|nr:TRAP transporter small permease [Gammaproteobacteria bacterium]MBL6998995.1 TRAP transporter small permease [Gammaproteobacteria bacterium]
MKTLNRIIHQLEDSLLISLLVSMILFSSGQIILRNFFDFGVIWIDPLLRALVLWTGLIGATVASRDNKHIRIDLISRLFNKRIHLAIQVFVGLFTVVICSIIAWHGSRWVLMDYQDRLTSFADLPSWVLELIIPLAFGLIALRYLIHSILWLRMFYLSEEQLSKINL